MNLNPGTSGLLRGFIHLDLFSISADFGKRDQKEPHIFEELDQNRETGKKDAKQGSTDHTYNVQGPITGHVHHAVAHVRPVLRLEHI